MLEQIAPGVVKDRDFIKNFCRGKKRVTNADAQAARILYEALVNGESWAVKELLDRTEGKAKERREDVNLNLTAQELGELTDEQLDALINRLGGKR